MQIYYRKQFLKQWDKLQKNKKAAVADAIEAFKKNPFDPALRNHALKGSMKGVRAISAAFDLRIIFKEQDGYMTVVMIAVGTHEDVY